MMNYPSAGGHAADPWCYGPGDADAAAAAGRDTTGFPLDMIADYSTDDLFELVREQEQGGGAGGAPGLRSTTMRPAAAESCLWSPPPPEVRFEPPSEAQMAAWLRTIVRGEELAVNDDGGGRDVPAEKGSSDNASTSTTDSKEKHPAVTEGMQEMRQPSAGGSSRRSHYGEAHNLTEKRRRHKINERLKTLQQLVPGCDDKSNQASTLDQTIQYLKSLQHHVQAMSIGPARPAAAAVPVVPPQYAPPGAPPVMPAAPVVLAASAQTTMVPFGAMLQTMTHYPAAVPVMMPASAAPLSYSYPAAPPPRAAAVAPGGAGSSSASHRHGSSSRKGKGGRSLRHKH